MITVCRWFENPDPNNPNKLVSRTLGKIAFVDKRHRGPQPQPGEFWFSSITLELRAGDAKGFFLVEPFDKIDSRDSLAPLNRENCTINPLEYNKNPPTKSLLLEPARVQASDGSTIPWIMPLQLKYELSSPSVISIVVNLGGDSWKKVD